MFEHGYAGLSHLSAGLSGLLIYAAGCATTLLVLRLKKKTFHNADKLDSLEILKARLAHGNISVEEFKNLKTYL